MTLTDTDTAPKTDIEAEITGIGADSTVPDHPGAVDARIYMDGQPACEVTLLLDHAGRLSVWGSCPDHWISDPGVLDTDDPQRLIDGIVDAVRNAYADIREA